MTSLCKTVSKGRRTGARAKFVPASLRLYRLAAGFSTEELAAALRKRGWAISRRTLADWETGTRWPPEEALPPLAEALGCPQVALRKRARVARA